MPKTQSSVVPDRRQEIKDKLSRNDLTVEKFIELALLESDVQRIDIMKFGVNQFNPSKVGDISQGFDPTTISEYVLQEWGPGKYRFSPVVSSEYVIHRTWSFGQPIEAPPPDPAMHPRAEPGEKIADALTKTMRETVVVRQAQDFIADSEQRAVEREVRPAQLMMQSMKDMLELVRSTMAQPKADPMATFMPFMIQMMQSQQTIFMAMIDQSNKRREPDGSGLRAISDALKTLEQTMTGRIGELFQDRESNSGGMDWTRIAEVAAPIIERALVVLERSQQNAPPRPSVFPAPRVLHQTPNPNVVVDLPKKPDVPNQPTTAKLPTEDEPLKLHDDPEMDKHLHEAADMAVEMLKSRDFASLHAIVAMNFPDFLEQLDPRVNPIVYTQRLKVLNPQFDKLRAEFADFMKWVEENAEEAEPETPGGGDEVTRG